MAYDREQPDLSEDLEPDFGERFDIDFFFSEYPYFQYKPANHEDVWWRLRPDRTYWDLSHRSLSTGPYRTDIVAVSINRDFLDERRAVQLRHSEVNDPPLSLNRGVGINDRARRYLRCYADFLVDGPMTREEYVQEHPSYGAASAERAFTWIERRGWLTGDGNGGYRATVMPLPIMGGVHAIEIKLNPNEWERALEQVLRADFYADHLWVAYDGDSIDQVEEHIGEFEKHGVGLIGVTADSVEYHLEAEKDVPPIDDDHLNRWATERLDLNERVLARL